VVVRVHRGAGGVSVEALAELARALSRASEQTSRHAALSALADAVRAGTDADVAVIRVQSGADRLEAVAVSGPSPLAAEIEGTRLPLDELPEGVLDRLAAAPGCVRRAADRAAARSLLLLPVRTGDDAASVELYR
jgi:hypothetical protein